MGRREDDGNARKEGDWTVESVSVPIARKEARNGIGVVGRRTGGTVIKTSTATYDESVLAPLTPPASQHRPEYEDGSDSSRFSGDGSRPDVTDLEGSSRSPYKAQCPTPPPTMTTNASEERNAGTEKRSTGRRRDNDARKDDDRGDLPGDDEVVFVSSSRGEGMGGSTPIGVRGLGAGSRYSGRLRRGDPGDPPSPRRLSTEPIQQRRRRLRLTGDYPADNHGAVEKLKNDPTVVRPACMGNGVNRESDPKFGGADGDDDWTCVCGKLVEGRRKRCGKCLKVINVVCVCVVYFYLHPGVKAPSRYAF
jgi:hypothetical protein